MSHSFCLFKIVSEGGGNVIQLWVQPIINYTQKARRRLDFLDRFSSHAEELEPKTKKRADQERTNNKTAISVMCSSLVGIAKSLTVTSMVQLRQKIKVKGNFKDNTRSNIG